MRSGWIVFASQRSGRSDSRCWLDRRPASMAAPYSCDLRERVVEAVERDGMSRNQAARHFGVAISTAIAWVTLFRTNGQITEGQAVAQAPQHHGGDDVGGVLGVVQHATAAFVELLAAVSAAEPAVAPG